MKVFLFCCLILLGLSCTSLKNGTKKIGGTIIDMEVKWVYQCQYTIEGEINSEINGQFGIEARIISTATSWKTYWYNACA
jgi:hypothetical protein